MNNQTFKSQLQIIAVFNANDKVMSIKECANWLGCSKKTVERRIHTSNKNVKIIANFSGGKWEIPKIQFLSKIIEDWQNNNELKVA